jgi:predicted RNase H-like nuclease
MSVPIIGADGYAGAPGPRWVVWSGYPAEGRIIDPHCWIATNTRDLWRIALAKLGPGPRIVLDVPIGIDDSGRSRRGDMIAKSILGPAHARVFAVPCIRLDHARLDYAHANALAKQTLGCGISKQFWNLRPRIADVESLLKSSLNARACIREGHPELVFARLSGSPVLSSKHDAQGLQERLELLAQFVPDLKQPLQIALSRCRSWRCKPDDVVDAAACLVAAADPAPDQLPGSPSLDRVLKVPVGYVLPSRSFIDRLRGRISTPCGP